MWYCLVLSRPSAFPTPPLTGNTRQKPERDQSLDNNEDDASPPPPKKRAHFSMRQVFDKYKRSDSNDDKTSIDEKAAIEKTLTEKFEKEKADAISEFTEKAAADLKKSLHDSLLALTQFLRLAAARRSEEGADAGLDENMALEGVLLNVYSGDEDAVSTMLKLINGSSETTHSVAGDELQTTYGQVKAAATAYVAPFATTEASLDATEAAPEPTAAVETDPTVAHAGLTEIDSKGVTEPLTNGHTDSASQIGIPANADVADSAANAAAGADWGRDRASPYPNPELPMIQDLKSRYPTLRVTLHSKGVKDIAKAGEVLAAETDEKINANISKLSKIAGEARQLFKPLLNHEVDLGTTEKGTCTVQIGEMLSAYEDLQAEHRSELTQLWSSWEQNQAEIKELEDKIRDLGREPSEVTGGISSNSEWSEKDDLDIDLLSKQAVEDMIACEEEFQEELMDEVTNLFEAMLDLSLG